MPTTINETAEYIRIINKLIGTINDLRMGDCWCGKPADNPTFKHTHTEKCRRTKHTVESVLDQSK